MDKQKGIRKAVTDFGIARARIKHQDFRHRCLHVNKLPFPNQQFALKPNTYVIESNICYTQIEIEPVTETPLIRLFENQRHTKWPISSPNKVEINEFKFLKDGFAGLNHSVNLYSVHLLR